METITLTRPEDIARFWAKVDKDADGGCWQWTAAIVRKYGMFNVRIDGKPYMKKAHRMSYELVRGPIPEGAYLDHVCHNQSCVNPEHLRPTTHKQNMENRPGANANSKSGIRGVHWSSFAGKWRVVVGHNGKHYRGGSFTDKEEAGKVAKQLRDKLFTHSDADAA